jgi:hypothetical protein
MLTLFARLSTFKHVVLVIDIELVVLIKTYHWTLLIAYQLIKLVQHKPIPLIFNHVKLTTRIWNVLPEFVLCIQPNLSAQKILNAGQLRNHNNILLIIHALIVMIKVIVLNASFKQQIELILQLEPYQLVLVLIVLKGYQQHVLL